VLIDIGEMTGRKDDPMSGIDISEANARIPREARFDDGIIAALAFTLFFFALWLIPAGFRAYDIHTRDVLRREGHEANGEVIKSYTGRGSVGVVYRFSVDGVSCPGRANMIADDYRVQAPGEKILIRYLPNNPSVNQPANWEWFSLWELPFYLIGLGILAAVAALIIAGSRGWSLKAESPVVQSTVVDSQSITNLQRKIRFRWRAAAGCQKNAKLECQFLLCIFEATL
jgi:hypothetical protein